MWVVRKPGYRLGKDVKTEDTSKPEGLESIKLLRNTLGGNDERRRSVYVASLHRSTSTPATRNSS